MSDVTMSAKDYTDMRIEHERELREANDRATAQALELATAHNDFRLTELNNLRRDYTADRGLLITRVEHDLLAKIIEEHGKALANMQGRAAAYGIVLTVGLIALQIGLHFIH